MPIMLSLYWQQAQKEECLIKQKRVKMPFINFIYDVVFGYRKKEDIIPFLKEKE